MKLVSCFLLMVAAGLSASGQNMAVNATYLVDGNVEKDQYRSHVNLEAVQANQCVTHALGGVNLYLTAVHMNKTAGNSSDAKRETTCSNSAFLASESSDVVLMQCESSSHSVGSQGVSARDKDTRVSITEGRTVVSKEQSICLYAVDGAMITVTDHQVESMSKNSPAVVAGQGGTIQASVLSGSTYGLESPLFSSKGQLKISESKMYAAQSPIAYLRESGCIELSGSELEQGGSCGFLVFDGNWASATELKINECELKIASGPLFVVDRNNASISLEGNSIQLDDDCLMSIHGGSVSLSLLDEKLKGDIEMDSVAQLQLTLGKGAQLTSAINQGHDDLATVNIMIGKGSTWQVTANSYVDVISFENGIEKGLKQIKGKFDILYDATNPANSALAGKEYVTGGKGMLKPF